MFKFKGVIFDLDGTLANTLPDLSTAMNSMLRDNSLPERNEKQLLEAINFGARHFVKLSLPKEFQDNDDYVTKRHTEYTSYYNKCYSDNTFLYPGMGEAVRYLKKQGMKIAVFSNKQDDHCKALVDKLFDFEKGLFDMVLGQTALPTKPDPTGAFVIAGRMDLRPSEIAYVGDSHIDILTACDAGMFPIGVSWGYRPPEMLLEYGSKMIIRDSRELFDIPTL